MEQSPLWETNSSSASQQIPRILWNPSLVFEKKVDSGEKQKGSGNLTVRSQCNFSLTQPHPCGGTISAAYGM
jgi:hypothetical protein